MEEKKGEHFMRAVFSLTPLRGFNGYPLSGSPRGFKGSPLKKIEKKKRKCVGIRGMLNGRNQRRWYEEEWRCKNEREVERIEEPVLRVVGKESEPVVANEEDEEAAKIAENRVKHVENLKKYFARTTESTTMAIPVHRQKATR
jgi:hypothetical protein